MGVDQELAQTTAQSAGNEVKPGRNIIFWGLNKDHCSVAVVGLGKKVKDKDDIELIHLEKDAVRIAASGGCRALDAAGVKNIEVEDFSDPESAAEGSILGTWKFQEYKKKKDVLPKVSIFDPNEDSSSKWLQGAIKAEAQNVARKLADTPSNLLTPTILANEVQNVLSPLGIEVQVHEKKWAEDQKMFSFFKCSQRFH
ncbi:hypothetical protein NQ318_010680 [Aromia moschata]|uniref:Cytosol aminopeptidase n=1 Tax=Aromia moschata TaxID=1265417 RepID=A0AAV8X2D5_9CUCU|nr:hypothetical protein NQ318_010680 [Aromia moschata]